MRFRVGIVGATLLVGTTLSATAASAASDPRGVWINDTGRGAIEIADCGDKLCGHVVWTKDTTDAKGCGKQIIGNARQVKSNLWDDGWIYSPERKRRYDVELKPLSNGNLRVKGYAGTKLFSKTMIWTPAPADLARCGDEPIEAKAEPETSTGDAKPAKKPSVAKVKPTPEPVPVPRRAKKPVKATAAGSDDAKTSDKDVAAKKTKTTKETDTASEVVDEPVKEPKVADAEPYDDEAGSDGPDLGDLEGLMGKYGFKEVGNGKCRLNVPFVTITLDCPD